MPELFNKIQYRGVKMSYKYSFKGKAERTLFDTVHIKSSKQYIEIQSSSDMFKPNKFEGKKVKVTIEVL